MIKDPDALYEWKRVKTSVMKWKPIETYDGRIVAWYAGGLGTKNEDHFGGFIVLLPNCRTTRVGGGFNDELREKIDENPDAFIGRPCELRGSAWSREER